MKKIAIYVITGITLLFSPQCTNPNKSGNQDTSVTDVEVNDNSINAFESSFSSPSPEEIMNLFEDSGLEYNAGVLNSPENIGKYLTTKSLSLNLGVYVTDAAYLNLFKQSSSLNGYVESILQITDKLEISGIYQEMDFEKLTMQLDNPDSLIIISNIIYHAVTGYLIDNNQEPMLCMISYGAFIELMYLTLESVKEFSPENPAIQSIADQYMQLDNLTEYASQYSENEDVKEILTELSGIKTIWSQIESTEKANVVSKTTDGKISLQGGLKHKLTEEQFNKLKQVIGEIRIKMIS